MDTPVLLLAYNRPKQTKLVLDRLQKVGATTVYVSLDGAKCVEDVKLILEVKQLLTDYSEMIIGTNESAINLGCKVAVVSGIDWFFDQETEGIILEDDCIPNEAFFSFCSELLTKYADKSEVKMISGNNPLGKWTAAGGHFFSRIGHVWGWATWKNRWSEFDVNLPQFNDFVSNHGFERAFGPTTLASTRKHLTAKALNGTIDTWDFQWNAHVLMRDGKAAIPTKNLVENIGFDYSGTHLRHKPEWIQNQAFDASDTISEIPIWPSVEYEMSLYLAQRANKSAEPNSNSYREIGFDSQSVKVLLINSTDIGGGAEKIAFSLHQQLIKKGHDSTLLVQQKKTDEPTVIEVEENWLEKIKQLNPDVIHVHNLHSTSMPLEELIHLSNTYRVLFTLHDSWITSGSISHPFAMFGTGLSLLDLKDWKLKRTQRKQSVSEGKIRWIAPSQWIRDRFFSTNGTRTYYVPNGISPESSIEISIPSNRYILFVANNPATNPYKDFKTLKKAWIKLNMKLGHNGCDLVCIGSSNPIEEEHGGSKLHVLPKKNATEIHSLMESSLFVVQPSIQDNAPLTILESHQACKPVVGSLVGGIPEMLNTAERSWLYTPGNSVSLEKSLSQAIRFVDESPTKQELIQPISLETMTDMYLGHYHELMHG